MRRERVQLKPDEQEKLTQHLQRIKATGVSYTPCKALTGEAELFNESLHSLLSCMPFPAG